jgi:hypothetical protein
MHIVLLCRVLYVTCLYVHVHVYLPAGVMSLMHPRRASLGRTAGDRAVFACSWESWLLTAAAESHVGCRAEHALPTHGYSSPTSWASCDTMMCKKRARARDLGSPAAALESSSASLLDAWEALHVVAFISH